MVNTAGFVGGIVGIPVGKLLDLVDGEELVAGIGNFVGIIVVKGCSVGFGVGILVGVVI